MTQAIYEVVSNENLTCNVFKMKVLGDTSSLTRSGQFINLTVEGCYLRRPISVYDYDDTSITIIYKVVGEGTQKMSQWQKGYKADILVGLGNGFDADVSGEAPVLIGGGVGIPPMYHLCKTLINKGKKPTVILGFNTKEEIFCESEFKALGVDTIVTTVDGSYGTKGFVTNAMSELDYTFFYTCGPLKMFEAIEKVAKTEGEYSFEERMGCGFGACMGCSCKTKYGNKRICKDGPVLKRSEVVW